MKHLLSVSLFLAVVLSENPVVVGAARLRKSTKATTHKHNLDNTIPSAVNDIPCNLELLVCPDGSSVGRTGPHCEFMPCPPFEWSGNAGGAAGCPRDTFTCLDGSTVIRDINNNCNFEPCREIGGECESDVLKCPNGSSVGRNPNNQCEFFLCPTVCPFDVVECEDGSIVTRALPTCEFATCPTALTATEERLAHRM